MDVLAASTRVCPSGPGMRQAAGRLLDLGFQSIVLDAELSRREWESFADHLPPRRIAASHLFVPLPAGLGARSLPPPRLGSLDADERHQVARLAHRTVEFLDRRDIPLLIVPPVVLEEPAEAEVRRLLERSGSPEIWERCRRSRSDSRCVARQFDSYLGTLDRLLELADRYERRVALIPGGFPSEQPDLVELERCLREFAGAPLGVLGDTLRLARYDCTAGPGAGESPQIFEEALGGVLVHDGDSHRAHLPLGEGGSVELDRWKETTRREGREQLWVVDLAATTPEASLLETRDRVAALLSREGAPAPDDEGEPGPPGLFSWP